MDLIDKMVYWLSRLIYILSAMFFFPVLIYSLVNEWLFGGILVLGLAAGWGLGWIMQDMHKLHRGSDGGDIPGG